MRNEPSKVTDNRSGCVNVWAGPLGFYGHAYGLWLGPLRPTIEQAQADADFAADCIELSPIGVFI